MNLAIIQPVAGSRARTYPYREEIATLGAVLRREGHRVSLLVLGGLDEAALAVHAAETRPQLVLLYVEALAADLAVRAAGALASMHGAPVIPFGPHARLCPDECLSVGGAEAVAVGPADRTVPAYLRARREGLDSLRTPGLWVKCETGVMRNLPAPPPDALADQPVPARDLYAGENLLDGAGLGDLVVARGGEGGSPDAEAASTSPWAAAWPVRHRPVGAVLAEMRLVADEQLDLGGWRVANERWASSAAWLAEFADACARHVRLPLRTTLHAPDVTDETAALLARAGCEEVCLPIGSATALIRRDVLDLNLTAEAVEAAFAALRRAAIRSVARVEIGAPYETPASLDHTVEFLRRLDPDRVVAVLHYPAPGSPAHRVARESGWLVPDPAAAHLAGQPAVALPGLAPERILTACEALPYAVLRPRVAPLIRASRRVRIGRWGTLYDLVVRPLLVPPVRRG